MAEDKKTAPEKKQNLKENINSKAGEMKEASKEKINNAQKDLIKKVKNEAIEIEEKIIHLPINKKFIFFVGGFLFLCAFMGLFGGAIGILGNVFCMVISLGMMYTGFNEKNAISKWLQEKAEKEKNTSPIEKTK